MLKIGNLWYLKGDMHLHTNYSDGEQLEAVLAQIVNCGMDFCAVTDHDTFSGSRAACIPHPAGKRTADGLGKFAQYGADLPQLCVVRFPSECGFR